MDKRPLDEELKFFEEKKEEWLTHYAEKFALIKDMKLINTFTTFEEAYDEGVHLFGTQPFLVKQIVKKEPIQEIPALTLGLLYASL